MEVVAFRYVEYELYFVSRKMSKKYDLNKKNINITFLVFPIR
jgi:hypothetical protein